MRASYAVRILCGALIALQAHHFSFAQAANLAQQRNTRPWYEAYDEGLRNIQQQRWQQAVDSLTAALAARKQQGRRVAFYGDRVDAYIPDYYLGVAFTELGRFTDAEAAFQRVTDQKLVVQGDRTFQTLQTLSARARTSAAALARGTGAPGTPQGLQIVDNTTRPPAAGGDTAPTQTANQPLVQNGPAAAPPNSASATVATAPQPTVQTALPAEGPKGPPQNAAVTPVTPALPGITMPNLVRLTEASAGARLRRENLTLGQVNRLRGTLNSAPANTVIAQTPAAGTQVQAGTRVNLTLSAAAAAPRLSEVDAVAAYYGGDYGTAEQILDAIVTANGKDAPPPSRRAWLFLASSITAQVLTGERNRADLGSARGMLTRVGSLDQFAADRRLISPRIWAALGVRQ